jgi:hypothetical protein
MSIFHLQHTSDMLLTSTPYSHKLDKDRKKIGYKNQKSLLLPFYNYIDEHYKLEWKYDFKNGNLEASKTSHNPYNQYCESHILVSTKGSIIHIFSKNDMDKNPFEKDVSLSLYPFGIFRKDVFSNILDKDIKNILSGDFNLKDSYSHACVLISKYENTENSYILPLEIVNIIKFAPFGNISREYLQTAFNLFQNYLSQLRDDDFVEVIKI